MFMPARVRHHWTAADVRQLIDHGFQAFNAGRLSEACHIFSDKMLAPDNDTTIGLTLAGALTPAGPVEVFVSKRTSAW